MNTVMQNSYEKHYYTLGESEITLHITYRQKIDQSTDNLIIRPYTLLNCLPSAYTQSMETLLQTFEVIIHLSPMDTGIITFYSHNEKFSIFPLSIFSEQAIQKLLGVNADKHTINMVVKFGQWLMRHLFAKEVYVFSPDLSDYKTPKNKTEHKKNCCYSYSTCNFITTLKRNYDLAILAGLSAKLIPPASLQIENDGSIIRTLQSRGLTFTEIRFKENNSTFTEKILTFTSRLVAHLNNYYNFLPNTWKTLKPGDAIDIIAISSHYDPMHIKMIKTILKKHNLKVFDRYTQQNTHSLEYSNFDSYRSQQLYNALIAPDSSAVWAIKGGSGASRILENLLTYPPFQSNNIKPIIGYSDVTGLHLALNTILNWPTIHGIFPSCNQETIPYIQNWTNCKEPITSIIDILKGNIKDSLLNSEGILAINSTARNISTINSTLLGGNMTLVCNLANSPFLPLNKPHILILEDVGISPRQAERFLDLLRYGVICQYTQAILFGEFLETKKPTALQKNTMKTILRRFAKKTRTPVFFWPLFGHGENNHPLPLNTKAILSYDSCNRFTLRVKIK